MSELHRPGQDPALESFYEDAAEAGHEEEIDNEERGCGHLQHNAAYVRSDVQALSAADGEVPRFVRLDQPVEYREHGGRGAIIPGWQAFPGIEFSLAYRNSGFTTTPAGEITAHLDRLSDGLHFGGRFGGDHYGELIVAQATDLLMSVGATHWQTPDDYIEETRERGLNLKVPSGPNTAPPPINPMVTRCWIVHPNGVEEGRAGIIGYGVLTRCIYTTGPDASADDADLPQYAADLAETGSVSLVTPGEPVPAEEDEEESPDASIGDFTADAEAVAPSNKEGRDVEAAVEYVEDADEEPQFGDPDFWEQYDVPVAFATAQNNRLSGLSKESHGTGKAADTVRHFYVLESFEDGRLERDADRFLCKGEGERPDRPSEPAENPSRITCNECLSLMERWKVEEDDA